MPTLDQALAAVNPLDDALADDGNDRRRRSIYGAVRQNPDEAGKATKLSRITGVPAPVVARNLPAVEQRTQLDAVFDAVEESPVLRFKLEHPEFANVAIDDIDVLKDLEAQANPRSAAGKINGPAFQRTGTIGPVTGPRPSIGSIASGVGTSFVEGGVRARQGIRLQMSDLTAALGIPGNAAVREDALRALSQSRLNEDVATPQFESSTARGVYGGLTSIARNAPGLAASILTRSSIPSLAAAGIQTEAEAYGKYRSRGATPSEALLGGIGEGAVEVATERIPLRTMLGSFGQPGKAAATEFLKSQVQEQFGEQAATLLQDAIDTAVANPNKTWGDYWKERPAAAYETFLATLVQSGVLGAAHTAVARVAPMEARANDAAQNAEALGELSRLSGLSKTKPRDAQTFQDFVQSAHENGPVQDVYLDVQAMQQAGIPPEAIAALSPTAASQMAEAIATGGDLVIPVGEYAARIAGSEVDSALLPHLRTAEDALSLDEAQKFYQSQGEELRAAAAKVMEEKATDEQFQASANAVQTQLFDQLKSTGRFTDDVNTAYSTLMRDFYVTTAGRLGITPEEMFARYPLQVKAESVVGEQQLDQGPNRIERPATVASWSTPNREAWAKPWEAIKRLVADGTATAEDAARVKEIARGGQNGAGAKLANLVKEIRRRAAPAAEQSTATDTAPLDMSQFFQGEYAQPQQGGNRGEISFGRDVSASPSVITLFKNADLSTFLHEMGHFQLEVLANIANRPDAPQALVDDMNAALNWFKPGMTLEEWNGLSMEDKRPYHEQFARGFEAYLFEGKAPSQELQSLFQRFRAWLTNVYRSMLALDVEINPEIRQVFDRLLASEDAIRAAEDARSYTPLFENAAEMGETDQAYAEYQRLGAEASRDAQDELQKRSAKDMRWLTNARGRMLKQLQRDALEKRQATEAEVKAEVQAQPVYAAREALRKADAAGKLSIAALEDMYMGEGDRYALLDWKPLTEQRLASKDGVHPDVVAEQFGFESGDQLVRELLAAQPMAEVIEGITDQRMLERYGDITDAATMARAADEAIHNEARARFVATELKALSKATSPVRAMVTAAKEFAQTLIARKKVKDIKPSQHGAAEARAAKNAEKALRAGDSNTAANEKRNQLVQNYATRAAYDALDEVDKATRYLRKFDSEGPRKSIDFEYIDQIDALLERFDLRASTTNTDAAKRESLLVWVEKQREQGLEPDIPPELLSEAMRKPFREMTLEELRGLVDTVKQIEHLGRLKKKLLTAKDEREFAAVTAEISTSIAENANGRTAETRTPTDALGKLAATLKRFWASHIKAGTWSYVMDGGEGGPMWEYFMRTANEKGDMETSMRADATLALSKIVSPVVKAWPKMQGKGRYFATVNRAFTREGAVALALNTGNEGNLQRLLGGEGWSLDQIRPVLESLTAAEWQMVQGIWDHFESYRPQIAAKERRIYGKEPNWVEPTPFAVRTADGQEVQLKGGYYPIKYDPAASQRAEEHADAEAARRDMKGAYTAATTRRSFTKQRSEEVVGRPLLYSLVGVYSGVNDVIHDLSWHEWLIDANRLLRSKSIDQAIRSHYGPAVKDQFKQWVKDIAQGETRADAPAEVGVAWLRQGVSAAGMGFNVMSAIMQVTGFGQSMARVGVVPMSRGIAQYVANPIGKAREVLGKSSFMEARSRTQFRELNELRNQVEGQTAAGRALTLGTYFMMMRVQKMVDVPTWLGAYEKAIGEGNNEDRSVALADQAVIDAQGSGMVKDLSTVERGGQALKLFTVFYSFMNTALNVGTQVAMTEKNKANLAARMLMIYTVPPVLGLVLKEALTPGGGDDDPEKLARKLAAEQLGYMTGLMVGVREFSEVGKIMAGAEGARDYAGPAGVRVVGDAMKLGQQASQGDFDDAFRRAAINLTGDLTGLPSAQINRTINGIEALQSGETENPAAVVLGYQKK